MVIDHDNIDQDSIEEEATGEAESAGAAAPPPTALLRYLMVMAAAMVLMYGMPFFLLRSAIYDSVNPSVFARPLNYAFTTAGENADVVLLGDSTALLGIDPSQMSSDLGVKAINLSDTHPSLLVNDDLPLRRYLASNRPPKLIVFYLAPWDFDYGHTEFSSQPTYEGQEVLFREGTWSEIFAFVKRQPVAAGLFSLKFYGTAIKMTLHRVSHKNENAQLAATHGHMDNVEASVLSESCTFPPFDLDIRFDWVRSLAARYTTPQTRVLVYAAPIPACDNASEVLSRRYSDLPAAPPVVVPARFFSDNVLYIHPLPFAVPELTRNLTEAVRPILAGPTEQAQPSSADPKRQIR